MSKDTRGGGKGVQGNSGQYLSGVLLGNLPSDVLLFIHLCSVESRLLSPGIGGCDIVRLMVFMVLMVVMVFN